LQARDRGTVNEVLSVARQHGQPLLCRHKIAGEQLALGPLQLQREGQRVAPSPAFLSQQRTPGDEVGQRRNIGRRTLGSFTSNEIELGYLLSLLQGMNQRNSAIELIDNLKDLLLNLLGSCLRREQSADPEVYGRPFTFGDERIGGFPDAVV